MPIADETQVVRTLLEHMARREPRRAPDAVTIPASHYTSREHLARERATVLRRWPQFVGLSCDLPGPGARTVRDDLAVPVVLTRDADGGFHALVNACRHRGARVAEDGSPSRRLTCPYHAWSYDLDGTLAAVPDAASFPGVEPGSCALPALPAREWAGTLWVVPDPGGPVPASAMPPDGLGAIAQDLQSYGLESFQHWRRHRFELPINWKLVVDTFLEPYHFASLHKQSVAPFFVSNLCVAERHGSHIREVIPRRSLAELAETPEEKWDILPHSTIVYIAFPNVVVVMQIDRLEVWRAYPAGDDPGRCVCELDYYIPGGPISESAQRYWERNWDLTVNTVLNEDFAAMAGVQANLGAGQLDHLTAGRNEPALAMYHAALAEAMAGAEAGEPAPVG